MISSEQLQKIRTEARPLIEQQMDIALQLAAMRDVVATAGGDWSALKAVIKAEIQDKVAKVRDKAESTLAYADMLGLGNLNEKNSFAFSLARTIDHDPETGEITEPADPASAGAAADVEGGENAPALHADTNSTENVGASAGRLHSIIEAPTESPAGVSVDTSNLLHMPAPKPQFVQVPFDGTINQ